ncbi:hypothetical protein CRUP_022944 [Coryphaenoides rupestris]|nr:hypothetical protein CRUP_022944 [Coryphaenoides rupestris]
MSLWPAPSTHRGSTALGQRSNSARPWEKSITSSSVPWMISTGDRDARSTVGTVPMLWPYRMMFSGLMPYLRMYMQPTLFPLAERVTKTSVVSSSRCVYWKSARSIRWSFHLPSKPAPAPPTAAPLRDRRPKPPGAPGDGSPPTPAAAASGSGRRAYVGSGGRKASLAAMRPGQGGQQNRQHSSLRERPFIFAVLSIIIIIIIIHQPRTNNNNNNK